MDTYTYGFSNEFEKIAINLGGARKALSSFFSDSDIGSSLKTIGKRIWTPVQDSSGIAKNIRVRAHQNLADTHKAIRSESDRLQGAIQRITERGSSNNAGFQKSMGQVGDLQKQLKGLKTLSKDTIRAHKNTIQGSGEKADTMAKRINIGTRAGLVGTGILGTGYIGSKVFNSRKSPSQQYGYYR